MSLLLRRLKEVFPRSFLAEFQEIFGEANTQKLIDVYSGTTLDIPSMRTLQNAERDILIYEKLCTCISSDQTKKESKLLAERYKLKPERIRHIFGRMRKQIGGNRKFKLADELVGKLKRSQIKVEHKARRKM